MGWLVCGKVWGREELAFNFFSFPPFFFVLDDVCSAFSPAEGKLLRLSFREEYSRKRW